MTDFRDGWYRPLVFSPQRELRGKNIYERTVLFLPIRHQGWGEPKPAAEARDGGGAAEEQPSALLKLVMRMQEALEEMRQDSCFCRLPRLL
jgi:hypothetical protein